MTGTIVIQGDWVITGNTINGERMAVVGAVDSASHTLTSDGQYADPHSGLSPVHRDAWRRLIVASRRRDRSSAGIPDKPQAVGLHSI